MSNITKKCIFPFTFNGIEYHGCMADDEFAGKFWCSTKVDEEREHVIGFWGHCRRGCYIDPKNNSECIRFIVFCLVQIDISMDVISKTHVSLISSGQNTKLTFLDICVLKNLQYMLCFVAL